MTKEKEQGLETQDNPELILSIIKLLEHGAHFGHQTRRWNPKMREYILKDDAGVLEKHNGIYLHDLAKTVMQIEEAIKIVESVIAHHGRILFVGTKKQAASLIKECAEACGQFYVDKRWLGGALTNLTTIQKSVKKLKDIKASLEKNDTNLKKKELHLLEKQEKKLLINLGGITTMRKIPSLMIVVDPFKEKIAVAEANKLGIPVLGLVDTNCDPDFIDHVIPCNDDSSRTIKYILGILTQAINNKRNEMSLAMAKVDSSTDQKVAGGN